MTRWSLHVQPAVKLGRGAAGLRFASWCLTASLSLPPFLCMRRRCSGFHRACRWQLRASKRKPPPGLPVRFSFPTLPGRLSPLRPQGRCGGYLHPAGEARGQVSVIPPRIPPSRRSVSCFGSNESQGSTRVWQLPVAPPRFFCLFFRLPGSHSAGAVGGSQLDSKLFPGVRASFRDREEKEGKLVVNGVGGSLLRGRSVFSCHSGHPGLFGLDFLALKCEKKPKKTSTFRCDVFGSRWRLK